MGRVGYSEFLIPAFIPPWLRPAITPRWLLSVPRHLLQTGLLAMIFTTMEHFLFWMRLVFILQWEAALAYRIRNQQLFRQPQLIILFMITINFIWKQVHCRHFQNWLAIM